MGRMDVSVPDCGVGDGELVRIHEAGHVVAAAALGYPPTGVTVRGGGVLDGCSTHALPGLPPETMQGSVAALGDGRPFVCWPAAMVRRVEALVVIKMAGRLAELTLAEREPATSRQPATIAEQATAEAAGLLPEPPAALVERYAATVSDPDAAESDAEAVAMFAASAHGDDLASMRAWLEYLEGQARALVLAEAPRIRRLAHALRLRDTLGGEAVAAVLRAS